MSCSIIHINVIITKPAAARGYGALRQTVLLLTVQESILASFLPDSHRPKARVYILCIVCSRGYHGI